MSWFPALLPTGADDGRACVVEYLDGHGDTPAPDEAGLTTDVPGPGGRFAAERRYRVPTPAGTSLSSRSRTWTAAGEVRRAADG